MVSVKILREMNKVIKLLPGNLTAEEKKISLLAQTT
jgi:hypothetical protein